MQLMKELWFLLIALAIVSMGQALNPEQKLAPTTGAALQLLTNGDQQPEVPASLPSFSDDRSESTSIPIDQASMKHSQSSIDKLFDNITYAPHDIENSDGRYSPKHYSTRDDQNLDLISKYATYAENVRIASTDTGGEIGTNMGYIYRSASNENVIETNRNELQRDVSSNLNNIYSGDASGDRIRIADKGAAVGGLINNNYYYEKKSIHDMTLPFSKSDKDIRSNLDYIYKNSYLGTQKENTAIATETTSPNLAPVLNVQFPKPVINIIPNLKYLYETSTIETAQTQVTSVSDIKAGTNFNIDRLIRDNADDMILPDLIAAGQEDLMNLKKKENLDHLDGKARSLKNYAVVIGINNYADRSSLHTSVNDAETMAALLESYGYNVVKLTDITDEKPTKSNILEKALSEMKNKKDLGKVLIYFSGHGEEKGNNYYLIPQDGDGHTSSYISTQELQKSMKGLKSVALVVDACNAGGLENVIDNGQMILVSSQKDQPSNEVWFGSLSLFTYNLCNAMRDEEKTSNTVILERCFYKAKEATERWASWRLLVQTPEIKDKTGGYFSLK
jgi:hypothetical protein